MTLFIWNPSLFFFWQLLPKEAPEDRGKYSDLKSYICNSFATYLPWFWYRRSIFFNSRQQEEHKEEIYNEIVPSYIKTGSALIILIFVQRGYYCFTIFREKNKTVRKSFSSIKERQGAVFEHDWDSVICLFNFPPCLKRLSTQVEATLSNSDPRTHETHLKRRKIIPY